jgi:hypothetical protein
MLRIPVYLFLAICCIAAGSFVSMAESEGPAGGATVKIESLAVYSRMSADSEVIKHLNKGDIVTVELEMERAERAWCAISEEGEITGYVQCEYLKQEKKNLWESVGSSVTRTASNTTKITIIGNQVLVPVTLGYGGREEEVLLLLDTGSGGTIISTEVAAKLNLDMDRAIKLKAMVIGGGTIKVKLAQLSYLTVGPHRIPDMVIGVIEHKGPVVKFDGVLGMDFLSAVNYELDLKNQVINWAR